ncbi:phosphoribosylaminoimidazolesuccinocarboxamide synthase [Methanocorpusculum sp. MG]|uniref:Phosphoribosylaminoimidazole-succinocarboxamide synthase n=1 Tax=Methanocorpusculum petauri TaxID=3002863 RepID=A0ABT4IGC7_9EURY|nr:phosphoribosylaminoimidazolesuccinocarboxamide synthase [Methanocorpusculum petauri]MCZ0860235.1 phosphoribosylaminoimidazolesuccinocarboxamide synthase [Methanocorpusculum petauri]MDE2444279.1 phosphoribosylaminoimidazolesuccinocarboxamide synthase [Methanocorpusculum sp.]
MKQGDLLYLGKAKSVYLTDKTDELLVVFRDDITAFDGQKKNVLAGKGGYNAKVTAYFYPLLEAAGIPTHFLAEVTPNSHLVRRLSMIPLEVIVRNRAAGSLVRNYGFTEGQPLSPPLIMMDLKDDSRHDPMVTDELILAMHLATAEELAEIKRLALAINAVLRENLTAKGLDLIDMKFEFGRDTTGMIRLGDEISMDSLRLWDHGAIGASLDKDVYRKELGDVMETYAAVAQRICGK